MAKYNVYLQTVASITIEVEVDDNLTEDEARDAATEKAFEVAPRDVCAQCSGWGRQWSVSLGELEIAHDHKGNEFPPERQ